MTTILKTSNGETMLLSHDTNSPRPYSLAFRVQGVKGIWMDLNKSWMIENVTKAHRWTGAKPWLEQHDHPFWKKFGDDAKTFGHGGMDFLVFHLFVESAKKIRRLKLMCMMRPLGRPLLLCRKPVLRPEVTLKFFQILPVADGQSESLTVSGANCMFLKKRTFFPKKPHFVLFF